MSSWLSELIAPSPKPSTSTTTSDEPSSSTTNNTTTKDDTVRKLNFQNDSSTATQPAQQQTQPPQQQSTKPIVLLLARGLFTIFFCFFFWFFFTRRFQLLIKRCILNRLVCAKFHSWLLNWSMAHCTVYWQCFSSIRCFFKSKTANNKYKWKIRTRVWEKTIKCGCVYKSEREKRVKNARERV